MEQVMLPEAVNGSGQVEINAGVGRLPSLVVMSTKIYQRISLETPTSLDLIASIAPEVTLRHYGVANLSGAALNAMNKALLQLPDYSDNVRGTNNIFLKVGHLSLGLQIFPLDRVPQRFTNTRLQAFALFMVNQLPSELDNLNSNLPTIWQQAMEHALVDEANQERSQGSNFTDFDTLAFVFLAVCSTLLSLKFVQYV